MNEFAKTKIAFTVGLLATLYTLNPLITKEIGEIGFTIVSFDINTELVYYIMLGLLAFAVYFYSVQFISERKIKYVQEAGDVFYAIALSLPPAFILLITLNKLIIPLVKNESLEWLLSGLFSALSSILAGYTTTILKRKMSSKQKRNDAKQEENLSFNYLIRAKQLFDDNYFDMAILETFKAIDSAIKKTLLLRNINVDERTPFQTINKAREYGILSDSDVNTINEIRNTRNMIAHTSKKISQEDAQKLITEGENIITNILNSEIQGSFSSSLSAYDYEKQIIEVLKNFGGIENIKDSEKGDLGVDIEFEYKGRKYFIEAKHLTRDKVGLKSFEKFLSRQRLLNGECWFVYNTDITHMVKKKAEDANKSSDNKNKIKLIQVKDAKMLKDRLTDLLDES